MKPNENERGIWRGLNLAWAWGIVIKLKIVIITNLQCILVASWEKMIIFLYWAES